MKFKLSKNTNAIILILSGLYLILLNILLNFTHSLVIPLIGVVFVSYISWRHGAIAGLVLTTVNHLCNSLSFRLFAPELSQSYSALIISVAVHVCISVLLGYFGQLANNLKKEIERRKQVEESLRALQNELEQRVEKRTRELEKANDLLYQARKMEAIGQMAGTIAHDFNNYLGIILGYSSFLSKTLDTATPAYEYAKNIEKAAETAGQLTSQILSFARKKKFALQEVNLNELVKELIPLISTVVKHRITIHHIADPQLPVFQGGVDQIKSAILNLCINARDAMKTGGSLTLTTKILQVTPDFCQNYKINCQDGTYSAIAVSDTGTGMEDEVFNHLFEPFFTTKEEGKGTGMGLAAVYGIIQSHQGAVFAETELGRGSTFTMMFPAENKH